MKKFSGQLLYLEDLRGRSDSLKSSSLTACLSLTFYPTCLRKHNAFFLLLFCTLIFLLLLFFGHFVACSEVDQNMSLKSALRLDLVWISGDLRIFSIVTSL